MELLLSILIVYGMSAIVTQSKIFEPLRDLAAKRSPNFWKYLTSCMQCFPFWGGIFVSLLLGAPIRMENDQLPLVLNSFLTYLFVGSLFSGTTMFINTVHMYIKGKTVSQQDEKQVKSEEESTSTVTKTPQYLN